MNDTAIETLSIEEIRATAERISPHVRKTPLEPAPEASLRAGTDAYLKLECLQVTGSFKPRVSFAKLLGVSAEERARGAIASSAGGHGVGLSHAARALSLPATVFLPHDADPRKVRTIRRNGARLAFFPDVATAAAAAVDAARREALVHVPAFDDWAAVAAGGTVGLEILSDLPDVDIILVGMGGGGLATGMGLTLAALRPEAEVWGVQPEVSPVLARWLEAGRPVDVVSGRSVAEGLGGRLEPTSITFPLARKHVRRSLLVGEREIRAAMVFLLEEHQLVVEPSGAAALAPLLRADGLFAGKKVAVVLTGRNVSAGRWLTLVDQLPQAVPTGSSTSARPARP